MNDMTKTPIKAWHCSPLTPRKRQKLKGKVKETDPEDLALGLAASRSLSGHATEHTVADMALLIDARLREQNELLRKLLDCIGSDGRS